MTGTLVRGFWDPEGPRPGSRGWYHGPCKIPLHLRLVAGLCRAAGTRPLRSEAEHYVPLLLLVPLFRRFVRFTRHVREEALHRVAAARTGPLFILFALFAGRHLGRQQRREVVLPERGVDPPLLKKTPDMPRRVLYTRWLVSRSLMLFFAGQVLLLFKKANLYRVPLT